MNHTPASDESPERRRLRERLAPAQARRHVVGVTASRGGVEEIALDQEQGSTRGAAQDVGLFEDRIEHRRDIARRGIDDLQHLRRRGLAVEEFAQFRQEPRVLDRDYRLVGEALQELQLDGIERAWLVAIDHECADGAVFGAERRADHDMNAGGARDLKSGPIRDRRIEIGQDRGC